MQVDPTRSILVPKHCPQCGFESDRIGPSNAADTVRDLGPQFREALTVAEGEDQQLLRRRPDPQTWSPLEYAAHVRDLIALWGSTLHLALTHDDAKVPRPAADLPDRTASEQAYNEQEPSAVVEQIVANAERMAAKIGTVGHGGWERTVRIGDDVEMTALDIVKKVGHEGRHHLHDVRRIMESASRPQPD